MIALGSETKAVLSYRVGKRDAVSAYEFIGDLHERIAETHRCQLTTDGLEAYFRPWKSTSARIGDASNEGRSYRPRFDDWRALSVGAAEGRPAA